jgi:plastocyanin
VPALPALFSVFAAARQSVLFPAESGLESTHMFPGEVWERRFPASGRCEYACGPHPEMNGVVHVE